MQARSGAAILLGTVLLSAGCSQDQVRRAPVSAVSVSAEPEVLAAEGASMLERLRYARYRPYATPQELLADREVALVGVIDGVFEGRSLLSESESHPTRDNSVVVRVRVIRMIKDPGGLVQDRTAYVSLPRGVNALDPDGTITADDPNPSLKEVQDALAAGLRVLVVSQPVNLKLLLRPGVTLGEAPHPLPDGAVLLSGMHPQTFVVDQGDESVDGWSGSTFAGLLEQLEA